MEKNNIIHTKENPIVEKNYPIEKEDREIIRLEKSCDILSTILKIECVITLAIMSFAVWFNGIPSLEDMKSDYKNAKISIKSEYSTKI